MYESGCALSSRNNCIWWTVLYIQLLATIFCKQTIVSRNKPTTIAMSSMCVSQSSWHIPQIVWLCSLLTTFAAHRIKHVHNF